MSNKPNNGSKQFPIRSHSQNSDRYKLPRFHFLAPDLFVLNFGTLKPVSSYSQGINKRGKRGRKKETILGFFRRISNRR